MTAKDADHHISLRREAIFTNTAHFHAALEEASYSTWGERLGQTPAFFIKISHECTGVWGLKPCVERWGPSQSIPKCSSAANKPTRTKHEPRTT